MVIMSTPTIKMYQLNELGMYGLDVSNKPSEAETFQILADERVELKFQ